MLFSLGGSFLYYADRFKLYSAFCASHTKVPKVLVKGKAGSGGLDGCAGCWFAYVWVAVVDGSWREIREALAGVRG